MCVGDVVAETHKCVEECPVCYILTPENSLRLLSGESIQLGIVDLFVEVAQIGCRMCEMLCEMWKLNQEIFRPGLEVNVKRQGQGGEPLVLLRGLLFEISEPLDLESLYQGTGRIRDKKFKSWAVPFGVYSKGSEWLDKFVTIRPPNPRVARDEVFEAVEVDLETCLSNHGECEKPRPSQLPTRLLLLDNDVPDRVFVHECKAGEQGNYVALSYCWGLTVQTKLLMTNVDDFSTKGIEVLALPKTIEDSIIATRKLGIKYLWIDSLCVIQDSIEDKDKEIVSMASIYKNATITISAAATTDCGQGFLEDRSDVQLRLNKSMCLPFLMPADEENPEEVIDWIYVCADPHMGHKVKRFSEESINTRAWTYQESTLAPRLLIFGSGPPQWHCKEKWKIYGLNIHPENLPSQECSSSIMKITLQDGSIVADQTLKHFERREPPKDDIGLWPAWFPLLENYSQRGLSYRTDKLLALSALAAEHQSPQNGTYAAGLWNASLPRGLLWRRSSSGLMGSHIPQQAHPLGWLRTRLFSTASSIKVPDRTAWSAQYVAPSWSPMSSTDPIRFESTATQNEDEFHTSLVKINDIHVELTTNLNPFGQLNFGYLDVTAPMCSISWQELTANFVIVGDEPFAYWDFIIPDDPAFFSKMCEKYEPSFNPQTLADRSIQDSIDEGDYSVTMSDTSTRIRMPVVREPASRECPDTDTPFTPILDVKQAVINTLLSETLVAKGRVGYGGVKWRQFFSSATSPPIVEYDECEFWLLEVERSMSPAGLVLKRVHGDIFARVGYFAMNRSLDPEVVLAPGRVQVRGRKTFNFGRPESKSSWNDGLTRRRIYLV